MAAVVAAVALGAAGACSSSVNVCDPAGWFPDHMPDPDLCPSFYKKDAGADAADAGEDAGEVADAAADAAADAPIEPACVGQCLPFPPDGWEFPDLVWMGPETQVPPCPDVAAKLGYEGHADLNAPSACGECRCNKPTGTCGLPATFTASSNVCPGTDPGAQYTPFDPPAGWDGSCTVNATVPGDPGCAGASCVRSVTVAPLTLDETACGATQLPGPQDSPPTWSTYARSCRGIAPGSCGNNAITCVPPNPAGFRVCVYRDGDRDCSTPNLAPYTEKHVFFDGFHDLRTCSPCTCSPPAGGGCNGMVSLFSDDACSTSLVSDYLIDATKPACVDIVSGSALASKSATTPIYAPGACLPSGGEPMGSADPIGPSTLCCIPSP